MTAEQFCSAELLWQRGQRNEKKEKKYQLWKMGTDIYSSVFYYLFYFFADWLYERGLLEEEFDGAAAFTNEYLPQ